MLTVCNVAFFDISEKSTRSVIDYLIEQPDNSINHEEIFRYIYASNKIRFYTNFFPFTSTLTFIPILKFKVQK